VKPHVHRPHVHVPFGRLAELAPALKEHNLPLEIYIQSYSLDSLEAGWEKDFFETLSYKPPLTVHGPFMDLSPGGVDEKVRAVSIERYEKTIGFAKAIGATSIVFHSGYEKWRFAFRADVWLENSLKTWPPLIAKAAGIKIAIENIFEDTPDNLVNLMQNLGSPDFGICFDAGHFHLFSKGKTLDEWIIPLKDYILELHLHDNDGTFDQHRPVGDGKFPFKRLFEFLAGKDLIYTVEAHSKEDALTSLERLKAYLPRS
jgi:sugar phosphate isomerase/epimerase